MNSRDTGARGRSPVQNTFAKRNMNDDNRNNNKRDFPNKDNKYRDNYDNKNNHLDNRNNNNERYNNRDHKNPRGTNNNTNDHRSTYNSTNMNYQSGGGGPKGTLSGPRSGAEDYFPPPGAIPGDFEHMPPMPGAMMYPPHFHGKLI